MMKRFKTKRKSERWVSNNRVLMGASKKDPGRNPNFDTEETKLLISLWGDPTMQRTLITTHRKHTVIVKLAEKMGEYGYTRSPEEINTRIKNLKCFYNRLKKDIEMGVINGATWKHFAAMDEIMTRSIFSVRPNEIPKPSLKYQLEIEQEERKRLRLVDKSSNANAQITEENISNSSHDSEDDIIEDNVNNYDDVNMQLSENEDNLIKIKEEDCADSYSKDNDIEETPLIIPKDEPLDDDDEVQCLTSDNEINTIPECMTPKLTDYVQLSNGNTNSIPISSNCHQLVKGKQNTMPQASPSSGVNPGMHQSIVFAKQANPSGKISLVPTNFLMQQNKALPQQIQIRQQPQQRIICSQPNTQTSTGIVTSAGSGRMKVLLVNAFQNGKTTHAVASKETAFANANLITSANVLKTNPSDSTVMNNVTEPLKPARMEEGTANKDPGMELLFNKLIVMQNENNEIQKQRLEMERQRFEFEKSVADKLIAALSAFNKIQTQENESVSNTSHRTAIVKESTPAPNLIDEFNGFALLTPKVEKMD